MPNTCKSREKARKGEYTGERVRNTWIIYLGDRDNWPKGLLIPDKPTTFSDVEGKGGLCMQAVTSR